MQRLVCTPRAAFGSRSAAWQSPKGLALLKAYIRDCRPARSSGTRRSASTSALPITQTSAALSVASTSLSGDQLELLQSLAAQLPLGAAAALPLAELSEGLETPIQLIYLVTLLAFLGGGAYLVVRQVLIRNELDQAAKDLGERIRTGEATCEDYFELGVILTRKKLYTQATKNLEKAKKVWDGEEAELAQVHNALGFCYFNMEKSEAAVAEYRLAVALQPGYVTAWNNLGDALEKRKAWAEALQAYQEALSYAPNNKVALSRSEFCRTRVQRLSGSA